MKTVQAVSVLVSSCDASRGAVDWYPATGSPRRIDGMASRGVGFGVG